MSSPRRIGWARLPGLVAGATMALSALPHSLAGWPALAAQLNDAGVTPDLATGLSIGWHFGGVAMLVCGALVVHAFLPRTAPGSPAPLVIGLAYLAFGGWAMAVSGGDPFFAVFLVPGALALVSAVLDRRHQPNTTAV